MTADQAGVRPCAAARDACSTRLAGDRLRTVLGLQAGPRRRRSCGCGRSTASGQSLRVLHRVPTGGPGRAGVDPDGASGPGRPAGCARRRRDVPPLVDGVGFDPSSARCRGCSRTTARSPPWTGCCNPAPTLRRLLPGWAAQRAGRVRAREGRHRAAARRRRRDASDTERSTPTRRARRRVGPRLARWRGSTTRGRRVPRVLGDLGAGPGAAARGVARHPAGRRPGGRARSRPGRARAHAGGAAPAPGRRAAGRHPAAARPAASGGAGRRHGASRRRRRGARGGRRLCAAATPERGPSWSTATCT